MKYTYDLHIHSALSPCGDNDMTPNNIVNMSYLKGLDIIAITDHNSCKNVRSAIEVADGKILVVPGIEITTSEEVHIVSYFPTIESAEEMDRIIKYRLPKIKNEAKIFGNQFIMDSEDNVVGEEEFLLVNACDLDIYEVQRIVNSLGGVSFPAHIDRDSYSIISNLGFIPPDISFSALEITKRNRERLQPQYEGYKILTSSDAHYLENIAEPEYTVDISAKTTQNLIDFLCKRE